MSTVHITSFSLLGFRLAPPVVGRVIDLNAIKHVTSQKLLDTYFMKGKVNAELMNIHSIITGQCLFKDINFHKFYESPLKIVP